MLVFFSFNISQLYNVGCSFADTKAGRYNPRMDPIIPVENWRKGSQVALLPFIIKEDETLQ